MIVFHFYFVGAETTHCVDNKNKLKVYVNFQFYKNKNCFTFGLISLIAGPISSMGLISPEVVSEWIIEIWLTKNSI